MRLKLIGITFIHYVDVAFSIIPGRVASTYAVVWLASALAASRSSRAVVRIAVQRDFL